MVQLSLTEKLGVSAEQAWGHLVGMTSALTGDPGLPGVEVTPVGSDRSTSEWAVLLRGSRLRWVQEELVDADTMTVRFRLLTGDPYRLSGAWRIVEDDGGVSLLLEVDFDFGIPAISGRIDPEFTKMMGEVMQRAASSLGRQAAPRR